MVEQTYLPRIIRTDLIQKNLRNEKNENEIETI